MRLVLREYLALQKESGELDALLPDLLLNMGLQPLNRAGSGSRQYGVDIPAVGTDPRDGVRKLVLVTAKQGDIDRKTWDGGHNADVRPSLNEILSIYLRTHVELVHQGLPVLIVLATGGDMDEAVRLDWVSYTESNTRTHQHLGVDYEVSFDFWGGDRLAALLEVHLVDEYLFPVPGPRDPGAPDVRNVMRRTLALAGDPNFDLDPYEAIVRATLDPDRLTDVSKRRRALRSLRLTVRILYRWGEREGNLRPALLAAEFVFLQVWHFIAEQKLTGANRAERPELAALYGTWRDVLHSYLEVLRPHCETQHGLFGYSPAEDIEYPIRVFDLLGHVALAGIDELVLAQFAAASIQPGLAATAEPTNVESSDDELDPQAVSPQRDDTEDGDAAESVGSADPSDSLIGKSLGALDPALRVAGHLRNLDVAANRACAIIVNNPAALSPPFDDNVVEVALVLTLLAAAGREDDARAWVEQLASAMGFSWKHLPARTPTYAGTYEDRVDTILGVDEPEFPSSTLLALLAEWAVVLQDPELYTTVRRIILDQLTHVDLQTWVPTDETDRALYARPAMDTGHMRTGIVLPATLAEFAAQVRRDAKLDEEVKAYSATEFGLPILSLIASRRFRTPPRPTLWRSLMLSNDDV